MGVSELCADPVSSFPASVPGHLEKVEAGSSSGDDEDPGAGTDFLKELERTPAGSRKCQEAIVMVDTINLMEQTNSGHGMRSLLDWVS